MDYYYYKGLKVGIKICFWCVLSVFLMIKLVVLNIMVKLGVLNII